MKPVALVADAILDCSARGDVVLDAFLGSGTTLIAVERTGRRCYGLELDPAYVDTIIRPWRALTGGSARHAGSNRSFDDLARAIHRQRGAPHQSDRTEVGRLRTVKDRIDDSGSEVG